MNVDSRESSKEGNTLFTTRWGVFDAIVNEDTVIKAFGGGTLLHFVLPGIGTARDSGKQAQIPIGFSVNDPSVRRWGTREAGIAGFKAADETWAAPLKAAAVFTKAVINHFTPAGADGGAVVVNTQSGRVLEVTFVLFIKGNDGIDVPMVKQLICSVVVAGGIGDECVNM